ncbi:MAG: glycerol-3-phosphate 1-O-acyltransferase PlsY [Chloroflexota bacterium]|nr:glycerol-3-phosphate 1-O-acyltransferase PlsY [Chloroflexota bacterium]
MIWAIIVSGIFGYAIGSIQFGLIVGRITRGVDIRDYGSGATGATNVIRTSGAKAGVLVIILDIAKGMLPVYAGIALGHAAGLDHDERAWVAAAGAFAAVCGHVWPVWAGFRGGKAVASGFGAALAMNPLAAVAMIPVAAVIVVTARMMSLMSVMMAPMMALFFVLLAAFGISPWAYAAYAIGAAALIVYRHRTNIERLMAGTEPRIGRGGEKRVGVGGAEL